MKGTSTRDCVGDPTTGKFTLFRFLVYIDNNKYHKKIKKIPIKLKKVKYFSNIMYIMN